MRLRCGVAVLGLLPTLIGPAAAAQLWDWRYSGAGIAAAGTMTTEDVADKDGYHRVIGISGQRNGTAVTALQPPGTAIPGNDPYAVDNRIRIAAPQLTKAGLGFALQDGSHANPFFADPGSPPGYLEFRSLPAGGTAEGPITFSARRR